MYENLNNLMVLARTNNAVLIIKMFEYLCRVVKTKLYADQHTSAE